MVSDRGPDLTSKDLEDAAFQLGIELDFNPPRTPHFKGTVESFFDGLEMWQDSAAVFPPCIPATPDELLVLLSKRADRTLSPRGIELGGMFYTSDELMALRSELASHNLDADRVAVRYNPVEKGDWLRSGRSVPVPFFNTACGC